MGKGSNASKIARARAEASKRDAVKPGGGGSSGMAERKGANAMSIICQVCRAGFLSTQSRGQLMGHLESKHPKNTFESCFPNFTD